MTPQPWRRYRRQGLYQPFSRIRAGEPEACERPRVQKGNRTPGFVEVREGNVKARMLAIHQRPVRH